ncbi:hypothetical protein V9W64_10675 [Neisseria leonii]|uniref:Uncharacterized protein n=1 Tax=Neisseria leonii TaxID=2995413 RepID=A0A9X4E3Z8_9NEIS|nr:hypothetical protein [Neisseria sp. 51.81]MDD9328784.1 hypothetical protein [Neisseria sp. 51.81]
MKFGFGDRVSAYGRCGIVVRRSENGFVDVRFPDDDLTYKYLEEELESDVCGIAAEGAIRAVCSPVFDGRPSDYHCGSWYALYTKMLVSDSLINLNDGSDLCRTFAQEDLELAFQTAMEVLGRE